MFMLGTKVTFQQGSPKSLQFHTPLFSYLMIAVIHRHYSLGNSFSLPLLPTPVFLGFPCGSAGKESACKVGDLGLIPGLGRSHGEGMSTHSIILAWKIPWTYSPWGHKESHMTERLSLTFQVRPSKTLSIHSHTKVRVIIEKSKSA